MKDKFSKHQETVEKVRPVRIRRTKKTLPGFLAKNVDAIVKWLKNYQTLYMLADDYGIMRLDRLPQEKLERITQNYVDVSEFIDIVEGLVYEAEHKIPDDAIIIDQTDQEENLRFGENIVQDFSQQDHEEPPLKPDLVLEV